MTTNILVLGGGDNIQSIDYIIKDIIPKITQNKNISCDIMNHNPQSALVLEYMKKYNMNFLELNFNKIEDLKKLQRNKYDIITFDRGVTYYVNWNLYHVLELCHSMKLNGKFHILDWNIRHSTMIVMDEKSLNRAIELLAPQVEKYTKYQGLYIETPSVFKIPNNAIEWNLSIKFSDRYQVYKSLVDHRNNYDLDAVIGTLKNVFDVTSKDMEIICIKKKECAIDEELQKRLFEFVNGQKGGYYYKYRKYKHKYEKLINKLQ